VGADIHDFPDDVCEITIAAPVKVHIQGCALTALPVRTTAPERCGRVVGQRPFGIRSTYPRTYMHLRRPAMESRETTIGLLATTTRGSGRDED
jgi:hypothetical protein